MYAQEKAYTLNGAVHIDGGETCKYQVVFRMKGDAFKGYSLTWVAGSEPLKATVKGVINKRAQTMDFTETAMDPTFAQSNTDACMFDIKTHYVLRDGRYLLTGKFKGRNEQNKPCDNGSVELEGFYTAGGPFEIKTPRVEVKKPASAPEAIINAEPGMAYQMATTDETHEYAWTTDTCIMEIWDGGVVDGDEVTVIYNGRKMLENYELTGNKKQLMLLLENNINTLEIRAENEGNTRPNTAKVTLRGGGNSRGVITYLDAGTSTTIRLRR
jgi:hypothetical protein